MIETHPVQYGQSTKGPRIAATVPTVVSLRAYEVYCHIYREQQSLITGGCRGGFSVGELVCYLYAHSFPKSEWRQRFEEATTGMTLR